MLASEFPEVPVSYIKETLEVRKYFYESFLSIDRSERHYTTTERPPYQKTKRSVKKPRSGEYYDALRPGAMKDALLRELEAAKRKRQADDGECPAAPEFLARLTQRTCSPQTT